MSNVAKLNMRNYLVLIKFTVILTFLLSPCHDGICASEVEPIPDPKKQLFSNLRVKIGPNSQLRLPKNTMSRYQAAIDSIKTTLSALPDNPDNKESIPITAVIINPSKAGSLARDIVTALKKRESYIIKITDKEIKITGSDDLGILHGLTTFENLIVNNKGDLRQGMIIDWPDHKIRALHVVLRMVSSDEIITHIIRPARTGHYNTIILEIADGVRLPSLEQTALADAWTKDELLEVVTFAKQNGLEVIPGLNLLTHQEKLLKNKYPELLFNKATYDPGNEKTYDVVLPMVDEVLDIVKPRAFHIEHDEVANHNDVTQRDWLHPGEKMLPAELFLKDIMRLHSHLKKRGVSTWMWGDMLISPREFPTMNEKYLHGVEGYSHIRKKLPKDIVICDWHYIDTDSNFSSTQQIAAEGFKVLGATWRKKENIIDFSKYVASMPGNREGMIATTWFPVQRKEWKVVSEIVKTSAEAFWNAK